MPSSPSGICLDCTSRAVSGSKFCGKHQETNSHTARREYKVMFDRNRQDDPIRKLYKCARWKAVRRIVMQRDLLCVSCGHKAITDVDHILPARLVIDNFGITEFYNPNRLQGLCHSCHSAKTSLECGWSGTKGNGTKLEQLTDRSNTTVVCGRAASGKTYYVEQNKQPNDLVWDYDVVMHELTGLPIHKHSPEAIGSVLALRDQFINRTAHCPNHVWLIVTNPKSAIVQVLKDAGARVVVLDTPDEVCQQRLRERFIAECV